MDKDKPLLPQRESLGRLLQRITRSHSVRMLELLAERGHDGLSFFHTALITNLDKEGNSISTLAERAGMGKQSMGQLVNELEKRAYIERIRDPNDRRAYKVQFTSRGHQLLKDARETKNAVEKEYATVIGDEGVVQLTALLQRLVAQGT